MIERLMNLLEAIECCKGEEARCDLCPLQEETCDELAIEMIELPLMLVELIEKVLEEAMTNMNFMTTAKTICWDCKKATGGCSWADRLQPVEGWKAEPTEKASFRGEPLKSFLVKECPEFKRDAMNGGLKRLL